MLGHPAQVARQLDRLGNAEDGAARKADGKRLAVKIELMDRIRPGRLIGTAASNCTIPQGREPPLT
jgi:hypothetical protein